MTRAGTRVQPKSAMAIALERALKKQAQAPKKTPAKVAPRKPAATIQPEKPRTVAALAIHVAAEYRAGRLDLKKPANELAAIFAVDVGFLTSAMLAAGFVRVRRGVLGELFFGRRK